MANPVRTSTRVAEPRPALAKLQAAMTSVEAAKLAGIDRSILVKRAAARGVGALVDRQYRFSSADLDRLR